MNPTLVRGMVAGLLVLAVAACAATPPSAAAAGAPTTDVNPITGSRGGTSAR